MRVGNTSVENPILSFRQRFGLKVPAVAEIFGCSPRQILSFSSGKKPIPKVYLLALPEAERQARNQTATDGTPMTPATPPPCPQCKARMRLRSDYLKHWFFGRLHAHATCSGRMGNRHAIVSFGILPNETEWRPLNRAETPVTRQNVPLPPRRNLKTPYERDYDWTWCPECGWLCVPSGKYVTHKRRSSKGITYNIFRCSNPQCPKGGKRLKCRAGRCVWDIPHQGRQTSLPEGARRCPHCRGNTIRNGNHSVVVNGTKCELIRLRCKGACKKQKVLYFDVGRGRFVPPLKRGGPLAVDPHRPRCAKGDTMYSWRMTLRVYRNRKRRLAVPLPVRVKVEASLKPNTRLRGVVVVAYFCRHKRVWKLPNGKWLYTHYRGRNLRRGAPLNRTTTR
jgi:hypothetical protein